jgi:hypothetical protein
MRKWSACVGLFVLTSAFAAQVACGGDDSASPAGAETDGGGQGDGASPSPTSDGSAGPDAGLDASDGSDAAGDDAGPTATAQILGYAFSNAPAAAESTPAAGYSYNASGGAMKITRTFTGQYTVTFTGLGPLEGSVALASSYNTAGGLCHWASTAGDAVKVRCLNSAGNVADAKFTLTVFGKGTKGATVIGFAHANDKESASYTPQASRSNNGVGGGAISASRAAAGTYTMDFGGLGLTDVENVQVMPYGDPNARCVVQLWSGTAVNVRCYDLAGDLADAQYTVLLVGTKPGGTARVVAYAAADESASASYAPALAHNEGGGGVTATRSVAGTYAIAFDGQNLNDGAHVQVSAHGQGRRCNVNAWAGTTVDLSCTSAMGTPGDNNYGIVVLQ